MPAPCQFLELFIGILDAITSHHRLHCLGQYHPVIVQVGVDPVRIRFQALQSFATGPVGNTAMGDASTHVTENRGIRQVSLPAGYWQFFRQVPEDAVGQTEVTLRIFKIYGIDLVWHCR